MMQSIFGLTFTNPFRNISLENTQNTLSNTSNQKKYGDLIIESLNYIAFFGTVYVVSYYSMRFIRDFLESKDTISGREIARKLRRPELSSIKLNSYESKIGNESLVAVDDLTTTFNDIGGMKEELEEVIDNIVLPMNIWKSGRTHIDILPCPTGVLLYGLPGTGKTLTARALAKECGATFLQISSTTLLDKWLGESDKLVAGLFHLARKLAPTIIFIDEIDSLLRSRASSDHQPAMATVQAVMLSEWDGLKNDQLNGPVIVVGATNRPNDIDPAFLRRLPVLIRTKTPSKLDRLDILRKLLANENLSQDINLDYISERTHGFTGSELRELVRTASIQKIKKVVNRLKSIGNSSSTDMSSLSLKYSSLKIDSIQSSQALLTMDDFEYALDKTKKSEDVAREYAMETQTDDISKQLQSLRDMFNQS